MSGELHLKPIKTKADAEKFFDYLIEVEKANFHPDDNFETYVNTDGKNSFSKEKAKALNKRMSEAISVINSSGGGDDVYAVAQKSFDKHFNMLKQTKEDGGNVNAKPKLMFANGGNASSGTETIALNSYSIFGKLLNSGVFVVDYDNSSITFPSGVSYKVVDNHEFTFKFAKDKILAINGIRGFANFLKEINNQGSPFNPAYTDLFIERGKFKPVDPVYEAEPANAMDYVPEEDRWMEKGGNLGFGTFGEYNYTFFTIQQIREYLKKEFPDSFGFMLYEPVKGSRETDIMPDFDSIGGYFGLSDSDIKTELYFPRLKNMHSTQIKMQQADENTYFYFSLEGKDGSFYIGNFGFKDRGDVPLWYSRKFLNFLMKAYEIPEIPVEELKGGGHVAAWHPGAGYASGERILSFNKVDYNVNVSLKKESWLEVDVNIKGSDTVNQIALSDTGAEWDQHNWGYMVYPKTEEQLFSVLRALRVRFSEDRVKNALSGKQYADGGRLCPVGTEIQTLIFGKDKFSLTESKSWAKSHGFTSTYVDEKENTYRIRQQEPSAFKQDSFRTIELRDGVKAVIGCPNEKMATGGNARKIWIGAIPEIFGYGICVAEETKQACMDALKREFYILAKGSKKSTDFESAFADLGWVRQIEMGVGYAENFSGGPQ